MKEYQYRVLQERVQLEDRLTKLTNFINSAAFDLVPIAERIRLISQRDYMEGYLSCLKERIKHFEEVGA